MTTYTRRGKVQTTGDSPATPPAGAKKETLQGKKVDGIQQVVDMLSAADPEFRKSLLLRIASENKPLAQDLLKRLKS